MRTHTTYMMHCGRPLISTFLFSKKEWYCAVCGTVFGYFDDFEYEVVERDCEKDKALLVIQNSGIAVFVLASKDCIPIFSRLNGCEQCKTDSDHWLHITAEEKDASNAAYRNLRKGIQQAIAEHDKVNRNSC